MTKGEILAKYGLSMLRHDLNEEADEGFEKFCKMIVENFEHFDEEEEEGGVE